MSLLQVAQTAKAWAAAVVAGAGVLSGELVTNPSLGVGQWVTVALAFLGGLGITYAVPNKADAPVAPAVEPTKLP